jgi:hypothetical protein
MSTAYQSPSKRAWNKLPILVIFLALITAYWTANGCGTNVATQTVRLNAAFDRTGTLASDGSYLPMTANGFVFAGDRSSNLAERGFVSVTLGAIPPTAKVIKVLLNLQGTAFVDPFDDFGTLSVDHVNVVSGIDAADFSGSVITASIAAVPPLPKGEAIPQVVELDVTDAVKADLVAGRLIASFRFQFNAAPNADGQFDQAIFRAFPDDPAQQPFATAIFQP